MKTSVSLFFCYTELQAAGHSRTVPVCALHRLFVSLSTLSLLLNCTLQTVGWKWLTNV